MTENFQKPLFAHPIFFYFYLKADKIFALNTPSMPMNTNLKR